MKQTRMLVTMCLALVFLLAGCGKDTEPSPSGESGTATAPAEIQREASTWRFQNYPIASFVETETAYYNLADEKIYFAPVGTCNFSLLCSRPDCTHADENCNAYGGYAMGYYAGKLYSAALGENGMRLISINPDGSGHEVVCDLLLPRSPNGQNGGTYFFYFCDEYLYYQIYSSNNPVNPLRLVRTNLLTGETEEPWKDVPLSDVIMGTICQFANGCWYFEIEYTVDGELAAFLVEANPETGEITNVLDEIEHRARVYRIEGNTVLYFERGRGFCQYDWKTKTDTCLCPVPDSEKMFGLYGLDQFYAFGPKGDADRDSFQIYAKDFQLLDTLELPGKELCYVTSTEDFIFFGILTDAGFQITHYVNQRDVGTGNLELLPTT